MEIDQLRYFLEVARWEHVGRAAKMLAISPSAISHSVAALEDEWGVQLFEKRGKNIALTVQGRSMIPQIQIALKHIEDLRRAGKSKENPLEGYLKISATHLICANWVTPALTLLQNKHSALAIELLSLRSGQVVSQVISGESDIGICLSPQRQNHIEIRTLKEGNLVPVVSKRHPILKTKDPLHKLSESFAVLPKSFQGIEPCDNHPMFAEFDIRVKPQMMFDSYDVAANKITNSECWSLFPDIFLKNFSTEIAAVPVPRKWNAPYNVSMIWHRNRTVSGLVDEVYKWLKTEFDSI